MVSRPDAEPAFGVRDLYAAYKVKCAADAIGFGRTANQPSRRQSRYLFYHIVLRMLGNVVLLTPEFRRPPVSEAVLTEAVLRLSVPGAEAEFNMLLKAATTLVDLYLTHGSGSSAHDEESFNSIHNGDLNAFLKAEHLGKDEHSPLLVQLLAQHNLGFASMPMPMFEGNPTQREFVAQALMRE